MLNLIFNFLLDLTFILVVKIPLVWPERPVEATMLYDVLQRASGILAIFGVKVLFVLILVILRMVNNWLQAMNMDRKSDSVVIDLVMFHIQTIQ